MVRKRKNIISSSTVASTNQRPIASHARRDLDSLAGQDVYVCPGIKAINSEQFGLSLLIGVNTTSVIAALANGLDYAHSISKVLDLTPGLVSSVISNLKKTGIIESKGYHSTVGKKGPPKHVYGLTDFGMKLAGFLQENDEHFRNIAQKLKSHQKI